MAKKYRFNKKFTYEGKPYYVHADTEEELGMKYERKLNELKNGRKVVSGDMFLNQWAEQCVETYKTNQNDITRKKYVQRMKSTILSELGDLSLKKIKPINCQRVLNRQTGNSPTQVNEVYNMLKFLFRHAYSNHLIPNDPTADLVKPKARKREHRRALTSTERAYFLEVGMTDRRYYLYLLMLLCGCRPSEAAECQGRDLITVKGVHYLHIRGTKTTNADRKVPIPDSLWDLVKGIQGYEYIACTSTGHKIDTEARRRVWHSYCRNINIAMGCKMHRNRLVPPLPLAPDIVPYCLRHEYCTELARRGVDIRIAQKLMGHSDIKLTANIYTNLNNDDLSDVAETINDIGNDLNKVLKREVAQ